MRSVQMLFVLILFMVIAINTVPLSASVTWSDETRVTELSTFDGLPSIAQTLDERIWIAWETNVKGNPDIAYKVYDGLSWTTFALLTTDPHNDVGPLILQAANGAIWLFWSSDRAGNYDVFYKISSDGGSSWSTETALTTNLYKDTGVSAAQTVDGRILVIWQREFSTYSSNLFYKIYNGSSWSSERQLTTNPGRDELPSVTQMRDGRIWVAWCSDKTGEFDIFYKISLDGGSTWSSESRLTISTNVDIDPAIIQARDGAIWIFWTSTEPKEIADDNLYYITSSDNGATWSSITQLTFSSGYDNMWPTVAQMNDKKIWVAFTSNRNDNFDIYYRTSGIIVVHDVAITNVTPSSTRVDKGKTMSINVLAENQGDQHEVFTVNCYVNSTSIGSQAITLASKGSTTLTFPWDTSTFALGVYIVKADASTVPGEAPINMDDNLFIDGTVEVVTHDVAIISVCTSGTWVAQEHTIKVYVKVKNEGTVAENINITAYYDSSVIGTQRVIELNPNAYTTLTFYWNTIGVAVGNYTISATAEPVSGETETLDNSMVDGSVRVRIPGDVDDNGVVDVEDVSLVARAFGTDTRWPAGTDWYQWNSNADINNDSKVNIWDLDIVVINYGRVGG